MSEEQVNPRTDADLALSLPEIARLHAAEPFEWDVLAEIGRRMREQRVEPAGAVWIDGRAGEVWCPTCGADRPIDVTASLRELTPAERERVERYFAANLRPATPADVDDALDLVSALEQAGKVRDARRLRAMVEEDAADADSLRWSAVEWKARRGRGVNWHLFAGGRSLCEAHLASLSDPYRPVSGKPAGDAGPCCDCLRVAADRDAVVPPVPATEEDGDA